MDDTLKCYKVLDLEPGATAESVRRSYIELSHVWDPSRYQNNSVLREKAELKRKEIDEAYEALRAFLPELQNASGAVAKSVRPERDFTELSREMPVERSRAILGILVAIVLVLIFACAFYLLMLGRHATPIVPPTIE